VFIPLPAVDGDVEEIHTVYMELVDEVGSWPASGARPPAMASRPERAPALVAAPRHLHQSHPDEPPDLQVFCKDAK
jgi:hypothetical protein